MQWRTRGIERIINKRQWKIRVTESLPTRFVTEKVLLTNKWQGYISVSGQDYSQGRPHLILIHKFRIAETQAEIDLAKEITSEKVSLENRKESGVAMR